MNVITRSPVFPVIYDPSFEVPDEDEAETRDELVKTLRGISETTFNRPNRYRSEAPLFFAAYGALQGSDAIIHFALDGVRWSVKPGFWMQPWTLASPAMLGQFPGAALLFRRGLIAPGAVLADLLSTCGLDLPLG